MEKDYDILDCKSLCDGEVQYELNGQTAGIGRLGFDKFLEYLYSVNLERRIIIRYNFKLSTGGKSMEDDLPFIQQLDEFDTVVKAKNLKIEYEPKFDY